MELITSNGRNREKYAPVSPTDRDSDDDGGGQNRASAQREDDDADEEEVVVTLDEYGRENRATSRREGSTFIYFYAAGCTVALLISAIFTMSNAWNERGSSCDDVDVPSPSPSASDCTSHTSRISQLPGFGTVSSCHYAGTLQAGNSRSMYYWLVEAEGGYENKPLIVWFNGGPMCSSLLGLFTENGPFVVTADPASSTGALVENPYSWHRAGANVLYVESPAGVGFSVDNSHQTPSDANYASSSLAFLETFWAEHPRLNNADVWLSGESYAGHYLTTLASLMLSKKSTSAVSAKLVGFMLGNGVTDDSYKYDGGSMYRTLCNHNFLSDATCTALEANCADTCNPVEGQCGSACANKMRFAEREAGITGNAVNVYDIYADKCTGGRRRRHRQLENHRRGLISSTGLNDRTRALSLGTQTSCSPVLAALFHPCIEDHLVTYLRRSDVIAAIHARSISNWDYCAPLNGYAYVRSVMNIYRNTLLNSGLKMLIYSGNIDDSVSTDGTRAWIRQLRSEGLLSYETGKQWSAWSADGQIAGFREVYNEGITFATVRGAGHMVPGTQPKRAYWMVKNFLSTGSL